MSSKRPDGRAAFLGTDDIVRRLRDVRPSPLGRWHRAVRNVVVASALAGVLGVGYRAANFWRADRAAGSRSVVRVETDETGAVDGGQAPQLASAMTLPAAAADAAGRGTGQAGGQPTRIEVHVLGGPRAGSATAATSGGTSLWLDGHVVSQSSAWSGEVARGRHELVLRHRHGEQKYTLWAQGSGQEVTFDLQSRRVRCRSLRSSADQGR